MNKIDFEAVIYVLMLPFVGFLIQALLGRFVHRLLGVRFGKIFMGTLAVFIVTASFVFAALLTTDIVNSPLSMRSQKLTLCNWIDLVNLYLPFELLIDPLSITMSLLITGIGALIHFYATIYMGKDRDYTRFFAYMNLFIGSMLLLVLANNLALMFIGWEGVGLCSYLLIGFWDEDLNNTKAANKAFIINRIGDVGLLLAMFLLVAVLVKNVGRLQLTVPNWLSYDTLLPNAVKLFADQPVLVTIIALLLFWGAIGKSAQFPLYTWLPEAMAGPTPVSALIHAATMVTAGVYLLCRMHVFLELTPYASAVVAAIGAFTAIFTALIACAQTDIKRVLAYSTASQIGYMFIACGVGAEWAGIFHVVTHGFFKALLFLGAGAVIKAMQDEQDMRRYGNLWRYMPTTYLIMVIGVLAISSVPVLSGYWSKEAIISSAFGSAFPELGGVSIGTLVGWIGLFVSLLTAVYMTRLLILTFGIPFVKGEERWHLQSNLSSGESSKIVQEHSLLDTEIFREEEIEHEEADSHLSPRHTPREAPIGMQIPMGLLAGLSLVGGYVLYQHGLLENFLSISTFPTYLQNSLLKGHAQEWLQSSLIFITTLAAVLGILYSFIVYRKGLPIREGFDIKRWSLYRKVAYIQFGYNALLTFLFEKLGSLLSIGLWRTDEVVIDEVVDSTGYLSAGLGSLFRKLQSGYIRFYAFIILLGGLGILCYFVYAMSRLGVR